MAHLLRLIVASLMALAGSAHALIPATNGYEYFLDPMTSWVFGLQSACETYVGLVKAQSPGIGWTLTGVNENTAQCLISGNDGPFGRSMQRRALSRCPDHSAGVGDGVNCSCVTGYIEQGNACVPKPKVCTAGQVFTERSVRQYPPTPDGKPSEAAKQDLVATPPSCSDQCALDYAPGEGRTRGERDAATHAWSIIHPKVIQTGANCTSSDKDAQNGLKWDELQQTSTPAPTPCPAGTLPGDFNGSTICKPSGASASASGSSSTSTGNEVTTGGSSGSSGGSGSNGNGSGSGATVIGTGGASNSGNTQITVCDQTSCTTTSTSTSTATGGSGTSAGGSGSGGSGSGSGSGGSGSGSTNGSSTEDCARAAANAASAAAGGATCTNTTTTTKPVGEYCKEHPSDTACKGKTSSFGGDCAAGFKAQGEDAVLNAMAEETFRQNCKLTPGAAEQQVSDAEGLNTGHELSKNPNNSSVDFSPASIDTSNALGGSPGCIADRTGTIMGQQFTFKFSEWCQGFEAFGTLLLAVGYLLAAVIVIRG